MVTEKVLRRYPTVSRKILHIMVGNIVFILPLFQTREIMAFLAAAPFIFLTFLISPYSPIKGLSKVSKAGHELGLVYYSISWTILAYLFFDHMETIFYSIPLTTYLFITLVLVSFLATVVEAVTPRGLDNLTVPLIASFAYWYLTMV